MFLRRTILFAPAIFAFDRPSARASDRSEDVLASLRRIEATTGGRLGVAADLPSGRISLRGGERFPLCSTFKLLAAAAILQRVDAGIESLDRRIVFDHASVVVGSPITAARVGAPGMTLAEICEAAITRSDNTAGNLMLATIGGPAGLTRFAGAIGDSVTRLDRIEPGLNEATAGDPRDTTTPDAMLADLRMLLLGDTLSPASRAILTDWLVANRTGDTRLRAGMPVGWRVGDKTGTGENGAASDVALVWPPEREPLLIAVYLTETSAPIDRRNAAIADVARCIVKFY